MKFIFDEGLGENLSKALNELGEDVEHIRKYLGEGKSDIEVFEFIREINEAFLISRDKYSSAERKVIRQYEIGVFILVGKNLSKWDIIKAIINNWRKIKETAQETNKPFLFKFYRDNREFKRIKI